MGYFEEGGDDLSYTSYLLAWVPGPFVELADRGIDVNPEQCIAWSSEADVAVAEIIGARTTSEVPRVR